MKVAGLEIIKDCLKVSILPLENLLMNSEKDDFPIHQRKTPARISEIIVKKVPLRVEKNRPAAIRIDILGRKRHSDKKAMKIKVMGLLEKKTVKLSLKMIPVRIKSVKVNKPAIALYFIKPLNGRGKF